MKMKNIENMNALGDIAMKAVAGSGDDRTVVDAFVARLQSPIADALGGENRPLPFTQNRRG